MSRDQARNTVMGQESWVVGVAFFLLLMTLDSRLMAAFAGEVTGRVLLEGKPPAPVVVEAKPKKEGEALEGCGALHKISPRLLVSPGGGVSHAVVWLEGEAPPGGGTFLDKNGGEGVASVPAEGKEVLLDQKACQFEPHVLVVPQGGRVAIRNSDPVLHNVRIFDPTPEIPRMLMHEWQKVKAPDIHWAFEKPGRYLVRCGVHLWMYAWVVVAPHAAYGVTDPEGLFRISGVPPGRYTLHVWHETLGEMELPVEAGPGQTPLAPVRFPPYVAEVPDAV